jgi:hypothetical protein
MANGELIGKFMTYMSLPTPSVMQRSPSP